MKNIAFVLAAAVWFVSQGGPAPQTPSKADVARWQKEASNVSIVRDDWGIAHVSGNKDADAVFGMVYAQAEDDFNRVEANFITNLGLQSVADGESHIYQDLRARLYCDPDALKAEYAQSPAWLKALMDSWADGLNFYEYKHPNVTPRVIARWEPWMALAFTEGSIGGDLGQINVGQLESFYGHGPITTIAGVAPSTPPPNPAYVIADNIPVEPGGSNGAAVAPSNTLNHHALLLINPHTSHYFRAELQMTSNEGLNAYGAVTWGQFFVYQGFNTGAGWMHTTSAVDDVDEYLETVVKKGDQFFYQYGNEQRPVTSRAVTVPFKTAAGTPGNIAEKKFTVYSTQHGPIVRAANGKWVAVRMMNEHIKALTQSYTRTKATSYTSFRQTMELHTNSSNNTIFADSKGNIAYFHGNYIPKRDPSFNWRQPVDGSNPKTDWTQLLSIDESPFLLNPSTGWLYNSNNWPWSAAGPASPKRENFPAYVDNGSESARGLHAIKVLESKKDYTLDSLVAAAFDSYQMWFEAPLPALIKAWDTAPPNDPLKAKLADQIAVLRAWDLRASTSSVATSLAVFWQQAVTQAVGRGGAQSDLCNSPAGAQQCLQALSTASDKLTADFGSWKTLWGDINRSQRLDDQIASHFDDSKPSIPVGFTSATQGSLASFAARAYPNTKKWYGTSGNSFVAVVEFGADRVKARAITAGGESGDPGSPHFNDQAARFATGDLRPVYYYREDLKGHTEREYHPGN